MKDDLLTLGLLLLIPIGLVAVAMFAIGKIEERVAHVVATPIVQADYERCVTVHNGLVTPTRDPTNYHPPLGPVA